MSKTARRLGRGLDSLVSPQPIKQPQDRPAGDQPAAGKPRPTTSDDHHARAEGVLTVPVDRLDRNPYQPRSAFDPEALQKLADSIRRSGMLQPVVARHHGDRLQIVAGERRWLAAKQCGLANLTVRLVTASDDQMIELALIENLQREDLNPIERARAYRQFCDRFGLTAEQIGERLGEDRTTVTNYMRLLELPEEIQALVAAGRLTMGHARCLLGVSNESRRLDLARSAASNELSVRDMEHIARQERQRPSEQTEPRPKAERSRSAHIKDLERKFEEAVRTKVSIVEGRKKGTGRIVLEYYSLDDFDRIAELLGVRID